MFDINDILVIKSVYGDDKRRVDDRTTSSASATIKQGEPIKRDNENFALLIATGDPEIATDIMFGVASAESTETSSVEGIVRYEVVGPGTILRGKAHTPGNISTDAELLAIEQDYVTFSVDTGEVTINENEGDDPNVHGLFIKTGDIVRGTLDVFVHSGVTIFGSLIGQTMD